MTDDEKCEFCGEKLDDNVTDYQGKNYHWICYICIDLRDRLASLETGITAMRFADNIERLEKRIKKMENNIGDWYDTRFNNVHEKIKELEDRLNSENKVEQKAPQQFRDKMNTRRMIRDYHPELLNNKLYYLATPYSKNESNKDMDEKGAESYNYLRAVTYTNILISRGFLIFSPVVYTHYLHCEVERDYKFWIQYVDQIMERCDGIILAPNWELSEGCKRELKYFKEKNKQIFYFKDVYGGPK
jgi:hypothetical protein